VSRIIKKLSYTLKVGREFYGSSEKPWNRRRSVSKTDTVPRALMQQSGQFALRPLQELIKELLVLELNQPANEKFRKQWKGFGDEVVVKEIRLR
jgi:hypothetical protein